MLIANNFAYGLLTPGLGLLMSCVGAYLGLQCVSRGMACSAGRRGCWLGFGALAFGTTCIWVMHFIAMLGYTIPGETILYNVPVTILSMVIAVIAVGTGLFMVGFGGRRPAIVLTAGVISGVGVASVHYIDMDGMRMAAGMHDSLPVRGASVLIAIGGMTALLWAVPRLRGGWQSLGAALLAGTVVSGLHYVGMAGMHLRPPGMHGMGDGMGMSGGGATATGFLLPLILGISIPASFLALILALSPNSAELREEAQLMDRIGQYRTTGPARSLPESGGSGATALTSAFAASTGTGGSGPGQARRAAAAPDSLFTRPAAPAPALASGNRETRSSALPVRLPEQRDLAQQARPAREETASAAWHGPADAGFQCPNCTRMSAADFGRLVGSLQPLIAELRSTNANDKEIICAYLGLTFTHRHERGAARPGPAGRLAPAGAGPRVGRYLNQSWR